MAGEVFSGRYFDGRSAASQEAQVCVETDGLTIETPTVRTFWRWRNIAVHDLGVDEIRLGVRGDEDARLVLPSAARPALIDAAPEIFSGRRARRRMTIFLVALIGASAAVAAALFIGVPAASGPLARATPKDFEMRMGANLAAQIGLVMPACEDAAAALDLLTPVIDELAEAGDVGFPIRFQIVEAPTPNAFALPGGQIIATSGLLRALQADQEAFIAVIAHELGHVRARDGMRAFYRNVGLGFLLEAITGGSGLAQQAVLIGGQLTELRHTRQQETAADETAFEILEKADLDPSALARAFDAIEKTARKQNTEAAAEAPPTKPAKRSRDLPSWLSSHPTTAARVERARERAREGGSPPLSSEDWATVAAVCEGASRRFSIDRILKRDLGNEDDSIENR